MSIASNLIEFLREARFASLEWVAERLGDDAESLLSLSRQLQKIGLLSLVIVGQPDDNDGQEGFPRYYLCYADADLDLAKGLSSVSPAPNPMGRVALNYAQIGGRLRDGSVVEDPETGALVEPRKTKGRKRIVVTEGATSEEDLSAAERDAIAAIIGSKAEGDMLAKLAQMEKQAPGPLPR